jgi:hypothetical protein
MKTKDLINLLNAVKEIPLPGEQSASMVDEIIKRLEDYDKLEPYISTLNKAYDAYHRPNS